MSDAFTAVGLVILLVAEVQNAFWPSVYTNLVTIADIMRLVAYIVLVAGAIADQRSDLRALRSAYTALDRMRVNDAERAALEERARLAREIHDGLAQHLWFAKLKFERLAGTLSEADQPLAAEVTQALDTAIIEAREALVTMRASLAEDVPFADMLAAHRRRLRGPLRAARRVHACRRACRPRSRRASRSSCCASSARRSRTCASTPTPRWCASSPRSATASCSSPSPTTAVASCLDEAFDQGLGLRGMHERARLIGGSLLVMSELSGGTTVEVRAPLAAPGIGSVSETTERTTMAPDDDADGAATPARAAWRRPDSAVRRRANLAMRGTSNAPDIAAKGVQP